MPQHAHLITGGFPLGSNAGHDMDFARIQLLQRLYRGGLSTTVANDFRQVDEYLSQSSLLVTYVAGPYADEPQSESIERWLEEGGHWFALHGTSGGRAARVPGNERRRQMVRSAHHDVLGAFFLNHPPIRRFKVTLTNSSHPLFQGLPNEFEVDDELYLIEPTPDAEYLMTTELPTDPSPAGFGFVYENDTSIRQDGKTRVLATERKVGKGAVVYVALGHTHVPANNSQPFVDENVGTSGVTPTTFRGAWDNTAFSQLLNNAVAWGTT